MNQQPVPTSTLQQQHHDLVCIGFGATALSLAVSLAERNPGAKVIFLERQPRSTWSPLARLPGHGHMKTSFMNDIVTFENPRSKFTFLKFLHARNLLVNFTNVGKTRPSRELFSQYLSWCADKLGSSVRYNTEAAGVEAVRHGDAKVDSWKIFARDTQTGQRSILQAKRVVVAVGQQPQIPAALSIPMVGASVLHSSRCLETLDEVLKPNKQAVNIALIGDGEETAELFEHIYEQRSEHKVAMFMEGDIIDSKIIPTSDSSPPKSPNHTPAKVLPPELRPKALTTINSAEQSDSSTIAEDLQYRLKEYFYTEAVKHTDPAERQYQLHPHQRLSCAARLPDGRLRLAFTNILTNANSTISLPFDLIIAATGHAPYEHKRLLSPVVNMQIIESPQGDITVDAHYQVNFRRNALKNGRGLWVVGSLGNQNEDNVFPILAERGRRLVDSIMAVQALESLEHEDQDEQAALLARL